MILLAACTTITVNQTQEQNTSTNTASVQIPAKETPLKVKVESTEVAACALLTQNDGERICNLSIQKSEKTPDGCEQAFISPELPFPHVTIKITDFDSKEKAEEKLSWNKRTTGMQNNGTTYSLGQGFAFERDGNANIEMLAGNRVIRITDSPKGTCKNIDELAQAVYSSR